MPLRDTRYYANRWFLCLKDVRFKNQGLDSIEVQDNGGGISPQNYETLALKHYTSKLSTYDDLSTLQTFGFRGEALSSLCALSNFSVVTCMPEEAPKAKKLLFASSGKLTSTSVVSGQKGTTVIVEGLFHNLPVRRRELERNIKREWGKVVNLLNQYACIRTGVKFSVSQQPTKGRRMVLFSTKGNLTTRDNIINVFGVKTMNALITLDLKLELIPTTTGPARKQAQNNDRDTREILVRGHVSRPAHGEGRQTPDRQMFYVNGRPCGLPQFAKVFNEVYRSYNVSQSPFIFADIQLDTHLYDVNVSPDKRTILLHDQGRMLDNMKEALIELFEKQDVTVPVAQLSTNKQSTFKKPAAASRSETPTSDKGKTTTRQNSALPSSSIQTYANKKGDLPPRRQPKADDQEDEESSEEEETSGAEGVEVNEDNGAQEGAEDESTDDLGNEKSRPLKGKKGQSVSNKSAIQASNLITRWVRRGSTARVDPRVTTLPSKVGKGREKILPSFVTARSLAESGPDGGEGENEAGTDTQIDSADEATTSDPERQESPIPAIPPPTQPRPNPTPATISPRRSMQQVATIRIGEDTVTSVIGPPTKKLRTTHATSSSVATSTTKRAGPKTSAPLPSFGGRLTQMFAARNSSPRSADLDHSSGLAAEHDSDQEESLFVSQDGDQQDDAEVITGDEREESPPQSDEDASGSGREGSSAPDEEMDEELAEGSDAGDQNVPSTNAESDEEYLDEQGQDVEKVQKSPSSPRLDTATKESTTSEPTEEVQKRSKMLLKGLSKRKDSTVQLTQRLRVSEEKILEQARKWEARLAAEQPSKPVSDGESDNLEADDAEEKLSLKISKSDFGKMRIVGQFNLGFILAVRKAEQDPAEGEEGGQQQHQDDELFIIDQHASDEKYNFERLQASTVVQSQRLVQPKTLELTAIEEEVIMENIASLESNGFNVKIDDSGESPVGSRVQLLSLPLSRETTFSLADLEELIFLLSDNPTSSATTVPRPSKVRKMFAMRACRSSIMVGKALTHRQMEKVVRNMGGMEKPWNCPHGRPTMRHLCGLSAWDERGWSEGDGFDGEDAETDWAGWLQENFPS